MKDDLDAFRGVFFSTLLGAAFFAGLIGLALYFGGGR